MNECSFAALAFAYDYPEDFSKIVCQKSGRPSIILIVFRVCAILYSYAVIIWCMCQIFLAPALKLYISYGLWVQLLWASTTEFAFMMSLSNIRKFDSENLDTVLPWYVKAYWALFSVTLPAVVLSFIVFWSQMFRYYENVDLLYIFMGNVTPFISLLEFALVAFPLRIINFFYFLLHSLLYIALSVLYQTYGGKGINDTPWIYKDLDWRNPKHAVLTSFIALLIGVTAYVIFWALSRLKLSKWCWGKET